MISRLINKFLIFAPTSRNQLIEKALNNKKILIAMNAEKLMKNDTKLINIVNQNIGYPDGFGAVLALKDMESSPLLNSCELWLDIINLNLDKKYYFIGSTEEVIQKTISRLKDEIQGINIAGFRNGYFNNNSEIMRTKNEIKELNVDIIFVAMGSPKQEFIMHDMHKHHPALYMGLGGSFDIYSGNTKRAPKFLINLNLEWLHRLILMPKRIFRQKSLIKFYFLLISKRLK